MSAHPAVQTDPVYSASADVNFDPDATVYCARGWGNRHGRFYSPSTLLSRIMLRTQEAFRFTVRRLTNTASISPSLYAKFALVGDRLDRSASMQSNG